MAAETRLCKLIMNHIIAHLLFGVCVCIPICKAMQDCKCSTWLPRTRMREGVKQLVLSVCLFVRLSVCQFVSLSVR